MTDASIPPRSPGPEPDTSTAAQSVHVDDDLDPEDAPAMVGEGDDVEEVEP